MSFLNQRDPQRGPLNLEFRKYFLVTSLCGTQEIVVLDADTLEDLERRVNVLGLGTLRPRPRACGSGFRSYGSKVWSIIGL